MQRDFMDLCEQNARFYNVTVNVGEIAGMRVGATNNTSPRCPN